MVLGKRVFPIWVLVTFKGPMLNFENVQTIGTRKQHNSQLQWIFSLKLPASNIFFVWNALVFFPCADHLVALLPKKWWCFLWPMEIHDALRAAISRSQLGWDFCLGARLLRWSRVAKGSLLKSWDSTERYLRCIYGPSKGWTVWLEDDGLINQKFEQHVFFFPCWDTKQSLFSEFLSRFF